MKKKIIIILFIIFVLVGIPTIYYWPYIRYYFGYRIVKDDAGSEVLVNQFTLNLHDSATRQDAEDFARLVGGRIAYEFSGVEYNIEVPSRTVTELDMFISHLNNLHDSRIKSISHSKIIPPLLNVHI